VLRAYHFSMNIRLFPPTVSIVIDTHSGGHGSTSRLFVPGILCSATTRRSGERDIDFRI